MHALPDRIDGRSWRLARECDRPQGEARAGQSHLHLSIGGMASSPSTSSPAPRRPSYRDALLGSPQQGAEAIKSPQSKLDDERIAGVFADVADLTTTMQSAKRKNEVRQGTTALSPRSQAASTPIANKDQTVAATSPDDAASPAPSTVSSRRTAGRDVTTAAISTRNATDDAAIAGAFADIAQLNTTMHKARMRFSKLPKPPTAPSAAAASKEADQQDSGSPSINGAKQKRKTTTRQSIRLVDLTKTVTTANKAKDLFLSYKKKSNRGTIHRRGEQEADPVAVAGEIILEYKRHVSAAAPREQYSQHRQKQAESLRVYLEKCGLVNEAVAREHDRILRATHAHYEELKSAGATGDTGSGTRQHLGMLGKQGKFNKYHFNPRWVELHDVGTKRVHLVISNDPNDPPKDVCPLTEASKVRVLKHTPDATPEDGEGERRGNKASTTGAYGDYVFEVITGDKRVVLATESSETMAQIMETLHEIIKSVKFLDNQTMNPAMGLTVRADGKVAGGDGNNTTVHQQLIEETQKRRNLELKLTKAQHLIARLETENARMTRRQDRDPQSSSERRRPVQSTASKQQPAPPFAVTTCKAKLPGNPDAPSIDCFQVSGVFCTVQWHYDDSADQEMMTATMMELLQYATSTHREIVTFVCANKSLAGSVVSMWQMVFAFPQAMQEFFEDAFVKRIFQNFSELVTRNGVFEYFYPDRSVALYEPSCYGGLDCSRGECGELFMQMKLVSSVPAKHALSIQYSFSGFEHMKKYDSFLHFESLMCEQLRKCVPDVLTVNIQHSRQQMKIKWTIIFFNVDSFISTMLDSAHEDVFQQCVRCCHMASCAVFNDTSDEALTILTKYHEMGIPLNFIPSVPGSFVVNPCLGLYRLPVQKAELWGVGLKRGEIIKSWKRRYFCLTHADGEINYYRSVPSRAICGDKEQRKRHALGTILLEKDATVVVLDRVFDLAIEINVKRRTYMILFDTYPERNMWIEALAPCIKQFVSPRGIEIRNLSDYTNRISTGRHRFRNGHLEILHFSIEILSRTNIVICISGYADKSNGPVSWEVTREYSEFLTLKQFAAKIRTADEHAYCGQFLTVALPGTLNLTESNIETREILLESFLHCIMSMPRMRQADTFQSFIRIELAGITGGISKRPHVRSSVARSMERRGTSGRRRYSTENLSDDLFDISAPVAPSRAGSKSMVRNASMRTIALQ